MSSDSTQPDPNPEKKAPKPSSMGKETTEHDLWNLDSDLDGVPEIEDADEDTDADADEPAEGGGHPGLPARRATSSPSVRSKKPTERHIEVPMVGEAKKTWEMAGRKPEMAGPDPETKPKRWDDSDDKIPEPPAPEAETGSAISFAFSLSKIEKFAISVLLAALALAGTITFVHFSNRVPTRSPLSEKIDFPVNGKLIEITAASTYWREPRLTGEKADVVKRGTKLIPVLKLAMNAKPCALRIFFRNEDGIVVGDGITRIVSGNTELTIPATAGFDDIGMHAAYRTGESLPWVVQIFEGPDRGASREKFEKVLEAEISTDIR